MNHNRSPIFFHFLIAALVLTACATPAAKPTDTAVPPTSTPLPPTETASPIPPTLTSTPVPTDTPIPPTPTFTRTPRPTATATTAPSPTATGQYSTEFDDPTELDQWSTFRIDVNSFRAVEDIPEKVSTQIVDGKFHVELKRANAWMYYIFQPLESADVKLETEAINSGRNNNNVSLLCRYSEAGWYEFNIANNGLYWILRYDPNIHDYVTLASGGTTSINMGQGTNQYTAVCQGDQLSLYINGGKPIKTVTDKKLSEGQVGLSVSSFSVTPIILDFDWLHVSAP